MIHPTKKCPWCGELLSDVELEQNGCESCGETLDPAPEITAAFARAETYLATVRAAEQAVGAEPVDHTGRVVGPEEQAEAERLDRFLADPPAVLRFNLNAAVIPVVICMDLQVEAHVSHWSPEAIRRRLVAIYPFLAPVEAGAR